MSKLTDAAIAKLPLVGPDENQYTHWDELPSFGIRISRRSKTFVLKKDNKYHSLGRWPSVSLKQAREEAKRRLALKYFPKTQPSLQTAVQEYMVHQEARLRPGSFLQFRHHINRHFPVHLTFSTLSQKAITDALVELSPSQANHAHNIIKAFLNWCVGREYLDRNPLQAAKLPHKMASRERVLSDDEIRIILKATRENTQFNNIVQFLVYSAQRRTQVSLTQRTYANYQDQIITWPQEVMKSGQQHTIPLTQKFRTLIHRGPRGQYAFGPTPYQAWKAYADEQIKTILSDARQFGLGIFMATQAPHQIEKSIRDEIATNTALRLIGNFEDNNLASSLADTMQTTRQGIQSLERKDYAFTEFMTYVRGETKQGAVKLRIPMTTISNEPTMSDMAWEAMRQKNRERYGANAECGAITPASTPIEEQDSSAPSPEHASPPPRTVQTVGHVSTVTFPQFRFTLPCILDSGASRTSIPTQYTVKDGLVTFTLNGYRIELPLKRLANVAGYDAKVTQDLPVISLIMTVGEHTANEDIILTPSGKDILIGTSFMSGRILVDTSDPKKPFKW